MQNKPRYGTPKADVYSFAIILQELVYTALPFFLEDMSPKGNGLNVFLFSSIGTQIKSFISYSLLTIAITFKDIYDNMNN